LASSAHTFGHISGEVIGGIGEVNNRRPFNIGVSGLIFPKHFPVGIAMLVSSRLPLNTRGTKEQPLLTQASQSNAKSSHFGSGRRHPRFLFSQHHFVFSSVQSSFVIQLYISFFFPSYFRSFSSRHSQCGPEHSLSEPSGSEIASHWFQMGFFFAFKIQ
jgi:hypothetical protein